MKRILLPLTALLLTISIHAQSVAQSTHLVDGPYIYHTPDGGLKVMTVDGSGNIISHYSPNAPTTATYHVTDHAGMTPFDVTLHIVDTPPCRHQMPEKLFVLSDPHGRLDCFVSILQAGGVIDKDLNWSFGKNHLAIIGDVCDRGEDVLQIYWLIYKLEKEADDAGGHLSFMLGNHDPMMLMNDLRYTKEKYTDMAKRLRVEYPALWGPDMELGHWLGTRNTIEVIGDNLFVHAGLSPQLLEKQLSIEEINAQMLLGLYKKRAARREVSELVDFLHSTNGPIWYRGLVLDDPSRNPATMEQLDAILKYYGVKRIIVGHTIFDDISTFYDGKVIAVNVDNPENMAAGRGRAILIEDNQVKVISDNGPLNVLLNL